MDDTTYKYSAFISYKHDPDEKIANIIQRQIENYIIPKKFRNSELVSGNHLKKVFRDTTELSGNHNLTGTIQDALGESAFLIVIISENTNDSLWVSKEIEYFLKNHGRDRILTVISSGVNPKSCYPEILTRIEKSDGEYELIDPLAVDYRKYNCNRSRYFEKQNKKIYSSEFMRLIAPILGVSYDDLYQRQERRRKKIIRTILVSGVFFLSIALMYVAWTNHQIKKNYNNAVEKQAQILLKQSADYLEENDRIAAINTAMQALPTSVGNKDMPITNEARYRLSRALGEFEVPNKPGRYVPINKVSMTNGINAYAVDETGRYVLCTDKNNNVLLKDIYTNHVVLEKSLHDYGTINEILGYGESFYLSCIDDECCNLIRITTNGNIEKLMGTNDDFLFKTKMLVESDKIDIISNTDENHLAIFKYDIEKDSKEYHEIYAGNIGAINNDDYIEYNEDTDEIILSSVTGSLADGGLDSYIYVVKGDKCTRYKTGFWRTENAIITEDFLYIVGYDKSSDISFMRSDNSIYFQRRNFTLKCISRSNQKCVWEFKDDVYYGYNMDFSMESYTYKNNEYIVVAVANSVDVVDSKYGKLFEDYEYLSNIVRLDKTDALRITLGNGYTSILEFENEKDSYPVTETFEQDIQAVSYHDKNYTKKELAFIYSDKNEILVYQSGWGDPKYISLETNIDDDYHIIDYDFIDNLVALYGRYVSKDDTYLVYLVDTSADKIVWKKEISQLDNGYNNKIEFLNNKKMVIYGAGINSIDIYSLSVDTGDINHILVDKSNLGHELSIDVDSVQMCNEKIHFINKDYTEEKIEGTTESVKTYYVELCELSIDGELTCDNLQLKKNELKDTFSTLDYTYIDADKYAIKNDLSQILMCVNCGGYYKIELYDKKIAACSTLEKLDKLNSGEIWNMKLRFVGDYSIVYFPQNESIYINKDLDSVACISRDKCNILSIDAYDDKWLLVLWSDGNICKYDINTGKLCHENYIFKEGTDLSFVKWFYTDDSIIIKVEGYLADEVSVVLDKRTLSKTAIFNDLACYNPNTDSYIMKPDKLPLGMFKGKTMEQLINWGEEYVKPE